jgi:hypothetical protein
MSLELPLPSGILQTTLQRSRDLVAFGLQAADHAALVDLRVPDSFLEVVPARNRALDPEGARSEFRTWVLANGLRDCVEAIGPTLEWVRKFCFFWTREGSVTPLEDGKFRLSGRLTGDEWNTNIVRGAAKFDRLPLPEKLIYLQKRYSWHRPELSDHILSLNAVRNCLVHRDGIVGGNDLKLSGDQGLSVRWRKGELVAGTGTDKRVLEAGSHVDAGETVTVEFIDLEKSFALGERVVFNVTEYVDISLTFLLFGRQAQKSTMELQEHRRPAAATVIEK